MLVKSCVANFRVGGAISQALRSYLPQEGSGCGHDDKVNVRSSSARQGLIPGPYSAGPRCVSALGLYSAEPTARPRSEVAGGPTLVGSVDECKLACADSMECGGFTSGDAQRKYGRWIALCGVVRLCN